MILGIKSEEDSKFHQLKLLDKYSFKVTYQVIDEKLAQNLYLNLGKACR